MSYICLQIRNKGGEILKQSSGVNEINLVYKSKYQQGDKIVLDVDEVTHFTTYSLMMPKGKLWFT